MYKILTAKTKVLLALSTFFFLNACGPSLEMTRLVPSAYDISKAKRVSLQEFQDSSNTSFFKNSKSRKLEESLYAALGKSGLFILCSPFKSVTTFNCSMVDQTPVDAIFTGKIYNFSVRSEKYFEKREREEKTATGTRKVEYTVPYVRKRANLDVEIMLMQAKTGANLGSKRFTANREESFEEKNAWNYGDDYLKEDLIQRVTKNFARDLTPHTEKYNVEIDDHKDLQEGQKYLEDRQWFEAKRFFENYLRNNPNNAEAYYNLGLAYEMDRQYNPAAQQVQNALNYCTKNCKKYEKALKRIQSHQEDSDRYHEQVEPRRSK